jgi:endonuclease YncB( thermonuclease family)
MNINKVVIPAIIISIAGLTSWRSITQQSRKFNIPKTSNIGTVKRVSDGDTLVLENGNRIRLCGIDAPEKDQPLGKESKTNLERLIANARNQVMVQETDRDRYGRIVAEVFVKANTSNPEEEYLLNAEQLSAGMAYVYPQYVNGCTQPDVLKQAERNAIAAKKGVWSNPNSVKPWDFRKKK